MQKTDTISSAGRYNHFDTSPYHSVTVINYNRPALKSQAVPMASVNFMQKYVAIQAVLLPYIAAQG